MRLNEVKKAMNMKCAMNKLCGGGDTAKSTWVWDQGFSECKGVAFLSQWDLKLIYELYTDKPQHYNQLPVLIVWLISEHI